jgi:hypothetical protein
MTDDEIIEANCRQNFAAARGARIQIFVAETRIHPDDEHLQYGPISTALREIALTGDYKDDTIPYFTFGIEREDNYWESTADQRRVFCLILAEALADSGL